MRRTQGRIERLQATVTGIRYVRKLLNTQELSSLSPKCRFQGRYTSSLQKLQGQHREVNLEQDTCVNIFDTSESRTRLTTPSF